jgi:WD40-like Beta Propeller Repeat
MPQIGCFPTHPASEPKTGERIWKNTTKTRMASMKPVGSKTIRLTFCLGFLLALLLTIFACGGGDNNNSSTPPAVVEPVKVSGTPSVGGLRSIDAFEWAPDSSRIAYIARQDSSAEELYSSTPDGNADNVKVSGVLTTGGGVFSFLWSPDLTDTDLIAYLADQTTVNVNQLYSSAPDGSGNGNVSGDGQVELLYDWAFSASGTSPLVFLAKKDSATNVELYASFDNGANVVKLSGDIIPDNGNVVDFAVSPDGRFVAYRADQVTEGTFELYTVPIGGGTVTNVSQLSGTILEVKEFAWAPDSTRVAFRAFDPFTGNTGGNIDLFTNTNSGSGVLNVSNFSTSGDVDAFAWSPTSQYIAYTVNPITGSSRQFRLYVAPPNLQNQSFPISNIPAATNQYTIGEFQWSPNGSIIAFLADIDILGVNELLVVEPTPISIPVAISGTLADGGEVVEFSWAPNNTRIAYLADQNEDEKFELISVIPDVNSSNPRPDPRLVSTNNIGDVVDFAWSPDSSRIGYIADGDTLGVFELFTNVAFGTSKFKVSGTLTQGGDVTSFAWAPDSSLIAYQASQDEANKEELYVTQPF